eukprot:scaffold293383_cov32-Tisochrysis_lutea.AAC.1
MSLPRRPGVGERGATLTRLADHLGASAPTQAARCTGCEQCPSATTLLLRKVFTIVGATGVMALSVGPTALRATAPVWKPVIAALPALLRR